MIRGRVNPELYPLVTIEIADGNGAFHSLDVILDTAFDGELALPSDVIESLDIPHRAEVDLVLANSQRIQAYTYGGVVSWHDQQRDVEIVETAGETLLGMALLLGSRISIDARVGGEVFIEPAG